MNDVAASKKASFNDEESIRGADSDEEMDVAAMVVAATERDRRYQEDEERGRSSQREGVVDFEDGAVGDEGEGLRKRFPQFQKRGGTSGLVAGNKGKVGSTKGSGQKREAIVRHKPGELANANVLPGVDSAQCFGSSAADWAGLGLSPQLVDQLLGANFAKPTQCQQQSIPVLLSGRDALVKAPTGSGKTLAYLVPIIQDLQSRSPKISRTDGTLAVIVVPTRELCIQIQDVALLLLRRFIWIVSSVLIGGEHRGHEKARLRKGVSIVVATPGRLQDHLEHTNSFKTGGLRWLILDEADRLLDLGFQVSRCEWIPWMMNAGAHVSSSTLSRNRSSSRRSSVGSMHGPRKRRRRRWLKSATTSRPRPAAKAGPRQGAAGGARCCSAQHCIRIWGRWRRPFSAAPSQWASPSSRAKAVALCWEMA